MIKEYVLSMDELIEKYPLGSKHLIGDEKYIVREHIQPMASTNMASYPAIRFDKSTGYKDSEGTLMQTKNTALLDREKLLMNLDYQEQS